MTTHEARPVNYALMATEAIIEDAFGMRPEIYHELMGCIFDNRMAGTRYKHRKITPWWHHPNSRYEGKHREGTPGTRVHRPDMVPLGGVSVRMKWFLSGVAGEPAELIDMKLIRGDDAD